MNNDLLNRTITVSGKEEKLQGGKPVMKIKDEKGLTYTVYKTKQDGTESVAWGQIPDLNTATQIGYVEEVKQHPEHGSITYRTIRNFNPDLANTTPKAEKSTTEQNPASQGKSSGYPDEKHWEMVNYKTLLRTIYTDAIINNLKLLPNWKDEAWITHKEIEADANKRFFVYSEKEETVPVPVYNELPIIQQEQIIECVVCGQNGVIENDGHDCIPF